ncbi:MAG: alcohol dehydrogenase [Thermotogota bacterium]|nr:alcohol dehydrogenase [Thermotogota bacterium]
MDNFKINFFLPTRLIFGCGEVNHLSKYVKGLGRKALVVIGRSSARKTGSLDKVLHQLDEAGIKAIVYEGVLPNPILDHVNEAAELAAKEKVEFVVGLGGGSSIDSAKAIALTAANGGNFWDFVDGTRKPTTALPIVAIPTTHGTGTEADPFAVITNPKTKEKAGIGYDLIFPTLSVVDPELMITLPPDQTVYTSMDAFYHAIEAFFNIEADPFSDLLALDAMKRVVSYLPLAYRDGSDIVARSQLAWANTEAGITETLTGVIANHAIEHGLSGFHPEIPHGLGLAIVGPYLFEYLFDHIKEKLARVGREVFGAHEPNDEKAAELALTKLRDFQSLFGLNKKLGDLGVLRDEVESMISTCYKIMKGVIVKTPGNLGIDELVKITLMAF